MEYTNCNLMTLLIKFLIVGYRAGRMGVSWLEGNVEALEQQMPHYGRHEAFNLFAFAREPLIGGGSLRNVNTMTSLSEATP